MKIALYLAFSLMLTACGYHLVGQGESSIIPEGVTSANLSVMGDDKLLLDQLISRWRQDDALPVLEDTSIAKHHVTLRIEHVLETFVAVAFDASGLAIQYRLQLQAEWNMYQQGSLIWESGMVSVNADVFGEDNPSVIEAERERWAHFLRQEWAKSALNRLKSGF